ncbi:hypothetical protein SEA_HIRKO_59 [Arthrobacter phage Hirko]|nr:hypothetical protein SEA_HIRKO_59 [Arthrobacter phage Hirko]
MPKTTYTPTEADAITGQNVRNLRRMHAETLVETISRSGVDMGPSTLSRIENGLRPLSLPDATKLAAHWNTTPAHIIARPAATEQAWFGNTAPTFAEVQATPPALHAVPDQPAEAEPTAEQLQRLAADVFAADTLAPVDPRYFLVDLEDPMTPEQYRAQVWVPYLEARYAAEIA